MTARHVRAGAHSSDRLAALTTSDKAVIHAGFSKTASTTLQDHLFDKHPDIYCLGKPQSETLIAELRKPDGYFDTNTMQRTVEEIIENAPPPSEAVWLFSDESAPRPYEVRYLVAKRLKELLPNARLVFVIRNQFSLIESWYADGGRMLHAPKPFRGRHVSMRNLLDYEIDRWYSSFLGELDFDDVIRIYEEFFHRSNINVMLFEDFVDNQASFINTLSDHCQFDAKIALETVSGGHSNPRTTSTDIYYLRFRNHFLPGVRLSKLIPGGANIRSCFERLIGKGPAANVSIPADLKDLLGRFYRDGNNRLAGRYGLNLGIHNYPL